MTQSEKGSTEVSRAARINDPAFSSDLESLTLEDLRKRRKEAEKEEQELSYVRRLLHGRIDILKAEMRRRAGDGEDVISSLPRILADAPSGKSPHGAFHALDAPEDEAATQAAENALADFSITNISTMSDDEVSEALEGLMAHERTVSADRTNIHKVIDRLSSELTRRYREGTAQVDDLLAAAKRQ